MDILIAEDNLVIQMLHTRLMEKWGYSYDLASNGLEAVKYAKMNIGKYDICLMDVDMPKLNGIEATKIIRTISRYFPILGLTSDESYKTACLEAGMDDFARKPCLPDDLFARIKKLSVKVYNLIVKSSGFEVIEVMPVDKKQAEELRELASKDLRKMILFENPGRALVVHKNTINKISHDFNVKGQLLTTFLNRDENNPSLCHLFKETSHLLPQTLLTEEEYKSMLGDEDSELNQYTELSLKAPDKG